MGQMLIRGLDDRVIEAVKDRARANGRSTEAEARLILAEATLGGTASRAKRSILDFVGAASTGRTSADIVAEIRALRDEWDDVR
jgi:hypothetical protein